MLIVTDVLGKRRWVNIRYQFKKSETDQRPKVDKWLTRM